MTELKATLGERTADLQRLQAEYQNYRRRVDRDRVAVKETAIANLLTELLPMLDDIGRARDHGELVGGFKSVAESLETVAAKMGLQQFGKEGEPFDPTIHEALMHSYAPDVTETTCVAILQPGYRIGERTIRPARVAVAEPQPGRGPQAEDQEPPTRRTGARTSGRAGSTWSRREAAMSTKDFVEKDYYKVLGVPKDATEAEIKKAYRKLAREFHPDANKGDAKAEERFKEISEANDILGDPKKRKEYDEARALFGNGGFRPGPGGGGGSFNFDLGDLFGGGPGRGAAAGFGGGGIGDVFGGLFNRAAPAPRARPAAPRPGHRVRGHARASPRRSTGATVPLRMSSQAPCKACSGTGDKNGTPRVCPTCVGTGQVSAGQRRRLLAHRPLRGLQGPGPDRRGPLRRLQGQRPGASPPAPCRSGSRRASPTASGSGCAARAPRASAAVRPATCTSSCTSTPTRCSAARTTTSR